MISADAIRCHIATPNAVKIELINCTSSLMDTAKGMELFWMAAGVFVALLASIFALLAWRTAQHQLKDLQATRRRDELRTATAGLIRAIHDLRGHSQDSNSNIKEFRTAAGREQVMFRLVVGNEVNRAQLYMATDVVIKAAGICHDSMQPGTLGVQHVHRTLIFNVADAMVDRLEEFDQGDLDASELASRILSDFETIVAPVGIRFDSKISAEMVKTKFAPFLPRKERAMDADKVAQE